MTQDGASGAAYADPVVIEAGRLERRYWSDLWRCRELLYFLAKRDVSVRYRQAVLGVAWALLRPLAVMVVFTIIFGRIAGLPSEGVPYSLLVFAGMVPWFFFAVALTDSSNSLLANANLLTKIYFPRLLVPASAVANALIDLAVSLALLLLLMAWFGHGPTWRIAFLPLFILLALGAALGLGLWFSALNVKYRDFQFIAAFVIQFGLYISPVGFSSSVVPEPWRWLFAVNPMVGVIDGFRWSLLGEMFHVRSGDVVASIGFTTVILSSGLWFFRRTERAFADVV